MVVRSGSLASSRDVSSLSDSESASASASSASSSDAELSSSSDSPSPRRLRARSAPRRTPRSRNALLPTSTPLSTSLWTTREKQFEKFRASLLALPVPNDVTRVDKAKGYSLHVMSVLNWVLPDSLLHMSAIPALHTSDAAGAEEDEEPLLTLGVHVSLFHSSTKRFFGNTWASPELALDPFQIKQSRHPSNSTLRYVVENMPLNFRAFFLSDVVDASCVGVLELVAYEKDPDSKATARVIGCGWTLLPLFSTRQAAEASSSLIPSVATSGDSVNVFTGSPRMLWELEPTVWNAQEKHEGCKLYYQLVPYEPMLSIAMLLRKNELVGALDPIPGLKHGNLANLNMGKDPKTLLKEEKGATYEDTLASFVKLAFLLPKTVQLEPPMDLDVVCTRVAIHLREEIEANLVARLQISRKAIHEGATSVQGEVSARVLKLALHNGRCFRTRQFTVPLKAEANGGDTLRCVRNSTKLRGFVCHPNVAIVLVLQYTVHFRLLWPAKLKQQLLDAKKPLPPEEDVLLVTMGARALVPSDGKKLYLIDKHHHATATSAAPLTLTGGQLEAQEDQKRVLHVDLLSGSPCRAYSDNTLYTPPDHVERLLQSREATTKDSFAFCDLQILLDEPPKPHEEPAAAASSPVKPAAIESNQKTEEKPRHSAEQWAKKLLGKASSNAVLAHTLNALAASPSNQEQEASKPPSPCKKQQSPRSVDPTPQVQAAPTSELSRASRTLLTRYGYMDSLDQEARASSPPNNQKKHGKPKAASASDLRAKSLELEANDVYKVNEVRFHFAAYRASGPNAAPSRVYFTFQFYTFPPTRTETLRLSKAFENGAVGGIQTFLLLREAPANKPSLAIQFDVDTTATGNPLEPRRFAEYLKWHSLHVDVWDADSLFQLGSFAVPLHELLRQGSGIKKFQAEVEIAPSIGGDVVSSHAAESEGSVGRIQLLMSNYGLKGANILEFAAAPANTSRPAEEQVRQVKHRVRARPLVDSNAELYRLLAQEGFYTKPSARTLQTERREGSQTHRRGAGDVSSLTPKEVAILCELFGSRKSASDSRSTRIACDLEGRTGFLALLSLQSEAPASIQADRVAQSPRETPVAALSDPQRQPKRQESDEQTVADSAQRLKRVLALATKHHVALLDAFALFDTDSDGFLSRTEFIQALRSLGTVFTDLSDADLTLLLDAMDANHDGQIAYREFATFVGTNDPEPTEISTRQWREQIKRVILRAMDKGIRVHHVFAQMDVSGDGTLSLKEFERSLQQLGLHSEKNQRLVRDLLAELDSDQDGTISYTEFLASLGISSEENQREVVKETAKDITEDVGEILQRLMARGVKFDAVFQHFDSDRNGTLSVEEFTSALNQLLQLEPSEAGANPLKAFERDAVELFVKTVNADGDGKIDYREFLTACGVSGRQIQEETAQFQQAARDQAERKLIKLLARACASGLSLHDVFQQFDADSDGAISLSEFQTTMQQLFLAQGLTEDDAALIARRFDSNRDGVISKREFQTFGRELQSRQQALVKVFRPHLEALEALDASAKLSNELWTAFCRQQLGLSTGEVEETGPLLTYFGLVDEDDGVDVQELGGLCQTVGAAAPSTRLEAVERLKSLLTKAKAQGVDLTRSFAHFDANGDGKITRSELKRGLLALECLSDVDEKELDSLLQQMDEDGSGDVSFSEFRALLAAEADAKDEEADLLTKLKTLMAKAVDQGVSVAACFAHFDKDGDGTITKEAFVTAMAELGLAAEEAMIHDVIRILDRNNSGTISLAEFKLLFPADTSAIAPSKAAEVVGVDGKTAQEAPLEAKKGRTASVEPGSARESTREKLRALLRRAEAGGVDVKQCFAHFDADGDGVITTHEFVGAMKQLTGFESVRDEEIRSLVQHLDKDASGSVSLEEFETFLRESTGPEVVEEVAASLAPSSQLGADQEVVNSEAADTADAAASKAPGIDGEASVIVAAVPSSPEAAASEEEATTKVESPTADVGLGSPQEVLEPAKAESPSSEAVADTEDGKPQEAEAVRPEQVANEEASAAAPSESVASEEATQAASADDRGGDKPKPPVRSVSFEQDKAPSAADLQSSKDSSKPKGVARRPSFAAARAAKAAEKAATQPAALGEAATEGLAKLRTLLRTAVTSGVPIQQSFSHFDKAGDGVVALKDFGKGLRELGADFETLSDEDVLAMAQSMDLKQQSQLRVEDFIAFMEASAPAVGSPKTTEKVLEVAEGSSNQPTVAKTTATAAARRPPPLRRAASSKTMEKKTATPSRGSQSARSAGENQTSSVATSALPSEETKPNESLPGGAAVAKESSAATSVSDAPPETASRPTQQGDGGAPSFDCSYSFHSNPEIRAVELKLRQAAVDAYQRGVLPLRVVAKFLEDDDRRGRLPTGSGRDRSRKKRRELLRVEFLQILMELGFSLLSDRSEEDEDEAVAGGRPRSTTRMNDHLYARQLERLSRYKHHVKPEEVKAHKQLVRSAKTKPRSGRQQTQMAEDSLQRFADEKTQLLRVLSYYRDGHKKALVYSLLREQVTTSLTLFPCLDALVFFELPFANPYNHHERFRIELLLPSSPEIALVLDLALVRNSDEWTFYRQHLPLAYGASDGLVGGDVEVEKEMIDDHDEVVMDAHDQLQLPLRLRWLDTSDTYARTQKTVPVSVVLKSCSHGHTVALFKLELQPQPFTCHRVLRFSHPAASIWRWTLRYPRGKFVVCLDPSVAVEPLRDGQSESSNSGLVRLKCRVGEYPSLESFFVVLYDDRYYARVHEVWQIRIQAKLRVDVHAVLGQSVRHELVIKGDASTAAATKRLVKCFTPSQNRDMMQFRPAQTFALVPNAFNRIEFAFCAVETGAEVEEAAGTRGFVVLVNLVDVDTQQLVGAWSVHVTLALPLITKTYELRLPLGRAAQKKISYANPWDQPQTIVLRSSAPRLLIPREPVLQLPSNGQTFLRLAFAARQQSTDACEAIYLFINDKRTDQNEECLLFQVTYE